MAQKSRELMTAEGVEACARFQQPDEVPEARRESDRIEFIPGERLLRVLIADGSRDTVASMSLLLKIWGHDVRTAYDGAEAFETALAYHPDVLLLSLTLPRINGCRLAQQVRRETQFTDTLLVAVTGYSDEEHRRLGMAAGFDLYLIKPVEPSTLETLLLLERDRLAGCTERKERPCGMRKDPLAFLVRSRITS
jgi:DNA-binding response OmpR family regulator